MSNRNLNDMQNIVEEMIKKYDLDSPVELRYIDLTSEIGELGKEILKSSNYGKTNFEKTEELKLEIGDVLFSLICTANCLDIDLSEALDNVLEKYNKRFSEKGNIGSGN